MEWYVYRHDTNKGTIYKYNVLQPYIVDQIKDKIEEPITFSNFKEIVKRQMQYYYWGKSEHEVIIKEWCGNSAELKIDIFDQLQLNWEAFVLHFWNCFLQEEKKSKEGKKESFCEKCQCKDCVKAHQPLNCIGCSSCMDGDDYIEFGNCSDYIKKEIEAIKEEEKEVQQEDVCKDCLCRTCITEDCSGCEDCYKGVLDVVKRCKFYERKETPSLWIEDDAGDLICNKCGNYPLESNGEVYLSDFCPFCGCRMVNCKCGELIE